MVWRCGVCLWRCAAAAAVGDGGECGGCGNDAHAAGGAVEEDVAEAGGRVVGSAGRCICNCICYMKFICNFSHEILQSEQSTSSIRILCF